ncbi:MAG: hypothetical protein ABSB69_13155, partial [Solirubrobacteraceae bacterium]
LRMICSGVCLRRFIRVPSSPTIVGARNSHKGRTELMGSGHSLVGVYLGAMPVAAVDVAPQSLRYLAGRG